MGGDHRGEEWLGADVATNGHVDGGDDGAPLQGVTHRRVDRDDWEAIYVVGDVHGCHDELRALLDRLDPSADDLVVFVGDLVRKGPDSEGVIDLVRSSPNMVSVRGNNEEKLLRGTCDPVLDPDDLAYLASLPLCLSWPGAVVVHAGLDPRVPFAAQSTESLLTTRAIPPGNGYTGPFWFDRYEGPPRVFFGHTVLDAPLVSEHAVGLDTGCVYGGSLTAYDCRRDEFVSVPASRTHRERSSAKIIDGDRCR